eukprot:Seg683.2 transcript_id=Seg683.2/GoldUCD/mRNA.D3Y31 product="hypothetical protein" protein_id=Seg683.2/GoldUCD/D3Y31
MKINLLLTKNDTSKKRIARPGEDDYAVVVKRRSQWSNGVSQGIKNMFSMPSNKEYGDQNIPSRLENADSSFAGPFVETNHMNTTMKKLNVAAEQWGDSLESNEHFRKTRNQSRMGN